MSALTIILIIVAAIALLLIGLLIIVAMQPAEFRISRKGLINAPPAKAFAQVNDFHNWEAWSPWANLDPTMKQTYEGPPSGKGAVYSWDGNKQVGEGRMTITESHPHELIVIKLEFIKPFTATNTTEFAFAPKGSQTEVTWTMLGKNNFMMKAMHMLMNMEKILGKEFDKGLAAMKIAAERA
jgi:hypothetical protein